MTVNEIMQQLAGMGSEQTRKTFTNHGATGNFFGVKVGDLKTIQKKVKKNHQLSLDLYNTGNSDAMYLAGLIADEKQITKKDLQSWAENATWMDAVGLTYVDDTVEVQSLPDGTIRGMQNACVSCI
ncbi:MAG: hypothetical protein EOP49_27295 [Sphingobacteriales bacterium]|nr:MAG: hypothetical protein EOP49_27295 [Sphingobacteriales bacterium]